jgi:hypothetical protein
MAERITGGQSNIYISGANALGQQILPAGLFEAIDSWDFEPKFTYEVHNEVGNPRNVRQQTEQETTVTINGGIVGDASWALAAQQNAAFFNKKGTPKFHIRVLGNGTDGRFDRSARWCTVDSVKQTSPAANKTMTTVMTFTAEQIE